MQSRDHRLKKNKAAIVLVSLAGLAMTLFAWGLSSPVGASPDEDFHLISIWCANDGQASVCEKTTSDNERLVSRGLILAACFAQDSEVSASCQSDASLFEDQELHITSRGNFQGTYPELFYSTMSLFASSNIQGSVIAMRVFNALLFSVILAVLMVLLPKFMRASLYFTTALTIVPLGLFLLPSVNPSSWAIMGTFAAFFGAAGALQSTGARSWQLAIVASFGLVLSAGARYDGLIYSLIAIAAAFVIAKKFSIPSKLLWYFAGATSLLLLIFFLLGGDAVITKLISFAGNIESTVDRSPLGVLAMNLAHFTELWAGFSGATGLGWLDTPIPRTAWMTLAVLAWGALFLRLGVAKKIQLWVASAVLILLTLVPLVTLQIGNSVVGENVQSRYIYPLFIVLVATMLFRYQGDSKLFSRTQIIVIIFGLFISQALSIYTNMTRYISGLGSGFSLNLNQAAESGWWWPTGPSPMLVLFISFIGFAMFLSVAFIVNKPNTAELTQFRMKQLGIIQDTR